VYRGSKQSSAGEKKDWDVFFFSCASFGRASCTYETVVSSSPAPSKIRREGKQYKTERIRKESQRKQISKNTCIIGEGFQTKSLQDGGLQKRSETHE
jgi:hypothetical protein